VQSEEKKERRAKVEGSESARVEFPRSLASPIIPPLFSSFSFLFSPQLARSLASRSSCPGGEFLHITFRQSIIQDVRIVVRRLQDRPRRTTRFVPSCTRAGNVSDELPVVEGKCARGCCDPTLERVRVDSSERAIEGCVRLADGRTDGRTNERTANTNAPLPHTTAHVLHFPSLLHFFFLPRIRRKYPLISIPRREFTAAIESAYFFHCLRAITSSRKSEDRLIAFVT